MEQKPITYGNWDQSLEDKTRCIIEVCEPGRGINFYQCRRKHGFGPKGEYCRQHDPAAVAARGKKRTEKYEAERVIRDSRWNDEAVGRWLRQHKLKQYETILKKKEEA